MLVLTRKVGQIIKIDLMENVDPQTPIKKIFSTGGIEVFVTTILGGQRVKLGLNADQRLRILRDERYAR